MIRRAVILSTGDELTSGITVDTKVGRAEVDVVQDARRHLADLRARGELVVPEGVSWRFAGSFENQVRSALGS